MFDQNGQIHENCTLKQLAHHIYFTETHRPLDLNNMRGSFIGSADGVEMHVIYKKQDKNVLDFKTIKTIGKKNTPKIIYADLCTVPENRLKEYNVTFKQIPYEVKIE